MLVDTGAWYALADTSDRHHEEARDFFGERAGQIPFVTTDLILAESWALIGSHLGRPAALTFWDTLRETRIPILTADSKPRPEIVSDGSWILSTAAGLVGAILTEGLVRRRSESETDCSPLAYWRLGLFGSAPAWGIALLGYALKTIIV